MMDDWVVPFLNRRGLNKREAEKAAQVVMEMKGFTNITILHYVNGKIIQQETIMRKSSNPHPQQQSSKYRVTVEVSARSASEAKRIVQGSSSGEQRRSNPLDWEDEWNARKSGDRRARELGQTMGDVRAARLGVSDASIQSQYRIAVEYDGLAKGTFNAFRKGWKMGLGSKNPCSNPYPDLSRRDEPITLVRPVIAKLNQAGLLDGDAAERTVELMTRRMSLSETDVFDVVRDAAQRSGGRATSQAIANVFRERLKGNGREIAEQLATYRIQHI